MRGIRGLGGYEEPLVRLQRRCLVSMTVQSNHFLIIISIFFNLNSFANEQKCSRATAA
jgi:hypothetical protein